MNLEDEEAPVVLDPTRYADIQYTSTAHLFRAKILFFFLEICLEDVMNQFQESLF